MAEFQMKNSEDSATIVYSAHPIFLFGMDNSAV